MNRKGTPKTGDRPALFDPDSTSDLAHPEISESLQAFRNFDNNAWFR